MATYTTEIASDKLVSDNPIHQRLLKAYIAAKSLVSGNLLEVGCGEGRGVEELLDQVDSYLGIDKIESVIVDLKKRFPEVDFQQAVIPPFEGLVSNSFDTVVSFQVIEHIQDDRLFLEEIYRVLKPGGKAIISTPNIRHTLSRNPWHIREYTAKELEGLCDKIFDKVEAMGIGGNDKVWSYHEENRKSVNKIMRFDIFDLQHRLPAAVLRLPYEILNRMNRNKLHKKQGSTVTDIKHDDYLLVDNPDQGLDLFYVLGKKS
ncbi:class I SAM-dependent methyltransferase [Belliella kenyensis]|uniref:Class I SAM-dependent methyltransferase n=1 Tax=Belliella kenyensis TaxID=1472724 RepID=A0ABV8EJU1_9BACT|nr:class I SAM-dependent methyltransferase [Belliella kenyensis]MCH7402436.1 class I SAM-dependent methyltransferase [Belliella kenyensis]MDN3603627.1 methyltransferase domain-containing protein [Belliella kenyensis]